MGVLLPVKSGIKNPDFATLGVGGINMLRTIVKIAMIGTAVYFGYHWRYRLMNFVLANSFLRKMLVSGAFGSRAVREKMMQGLFSEGNGTNYS